MYKKIKATAIIFMMLVGVILTTTMIANAEGPNYLGWVQSTRDVTVGDTVWQGVYFDLHKITDTVQLRNNVSQGGKAVTFLPAGVVNYTNTVAGDLFPGTTLWIKPTASDIHNDAGWVKNFVWGYQTGANNTGNKTAFNISWSTLKCGSVTLSLVGNPAQCCAYNGSYVIASYRPQTSVINVHPMAITGLTATMINQSEIELEWTKHTGDDKTLIRYSDVGYPTSVTDGTLLYNDTGVSTSHTGLSGGDQIYYSAWGWNETAGFYSLSYDTADDQTNNAPVLTNEDPVDIEIDVDKNYPQVSVDISDADAESMDWTIEVSNGDDASGTDFDDTITCSLTIPLTYGATYTWWVNVTDDFDWTNETYTFTVRNEYAPDAPSGFTATMYDRFQIDLDWVLGTGNDKVVIVAKLGSAPSGIGDGTIIYNGSGTDYSDDGLGPGEHWYYIAYGWNETDQTYSDDYASADASTMGNTAPNSFTNEDPADESDYESVYNEYLNITVTDSDGDPMTVYFYWGNDTAIAFDSISSGGTASIYLPDYMEPDWLDHHNTRDNYTWYVKADDGYDEGESSTWLFQTSYAWDVNENGEVDILDVSLFVTAYGNIVTPGSIGSDINNDGEVELLDASLLVTHYGEVY